jgi:hypothetical protein
VRGAALWIVTLLASCAPDYGHSAFRCDAAHGCPAGQDCLAGRCRRGAPTGDGVGCGGETCDATQQCCVDLFNGAHCRAAGEVCPGTAALCDGREDCQAGDRCCADGDTVFCDASCGHEACLDAADCPATAPNCCFDRDTPWGTCALFGC